MCTSKAVPKGFQPVLDAGQSSQVDLLVSHFGEHCAAANCNVTETDNSA
jgi:hypothetical protein